MATQLSLYNDALLLCGERFLASLTVSEEARRLLDHVWSNGGVKYCLEQGQWYFAMRSSAVDYDTAIEPDFGYTRAFSKPTDWLVTSALCSDEYFNVPLTAYVDEAGYWYADQDTIYVRYVSNDSLYGMDLNKWPEAFKDYVAAHFASRVIKKLSGSEDKEKEALKYADQMLARAKGRAAQAGPTQFPAQGSWSRSRGGYRGGDGGNRGSLIG